MQLLLGKSMMSLTFRTPPTVLSSMHLRASQIFPMLINLATFLGTFSSRVVLWDDGTEVECCNIPQQVMKFDHFFRGLTFCSGHLNVALLCFRSFCSSKTCITIHALRAIGSRHYQHTKALPAPPWNEENTALLMDYFLALFI